MQVTETRCSPYSDAMKCIVLSWFAVVAVAFVAVVRAGPAAADDAAALTANCIACHAVDGSALDEGTPHIAGLRKTHLLAAMRDYKAGHRVHADMQKAVESLDDSELDALAAWYSEQDWVSTAGTVDEDLAKAGAKKARTACGSCHRRSGEGGVSAPRLAGQPVAYLEAANAAYRDGTRNSPAAKGKAFVMSGLSDEDIRALAHYYASLR